MALLETWLVTGLAAAALISAKAYILKRLSDAHTSLELGFVSSLLATALLVPVGIYGAVQAGAVPEPPVLAAILFVGLVNTAGAYAFFEALQTTDLSVVSPLRQTIPVFVAVLEPLVLPIGYSLAVLAGAALTTVGGYVTLAENTRPLEPLTRLTDRGPLLALTSALFLGSGAIGVKYVTGHVPIALFVTLMFAVMAAGFAAVLRWQGGALTAVRVVRRDLLVLGVATALAQVFIFATIALSSAARATILFRLSVLFNIGIGWRLLGEKHLGYRLVGSVLIMLGILAVL